jgi:hypothetical protein
MLEVARRIVCVCVCVVAVLALLLGCNIPLSTDGIAHDSQDHVGEHWPAPVLCTSCYESLILSRVLRRGTVPQR